MHTKYYTVEDFSEFIDKHKNKLTILSLNIDSLNSKFDDLSILVNTLAKSNALINIICIQEARIGQGTNIGHLKLDGYSMITQPYTEKCSKKGGLVTIPSFSVSDPFLLDVPDFQVPSDSIVPPQLWSSSRALLPPPPSSFLQLLECFQFHLFF